MIIIVMKTKISLNRMNTVQTSKVPRQILQILLSICSQFLQIHICIIQLAQVNGFEHWQPRQTFEKPQKPLM